MNAGDWSLPSMMVMLSQPVAWNCTVAPLSWKTQGKLEDQVKAI